MAVIEKILSDITLPVFASVKRLFDSTCLDDEGIHRCIRRQLVGDNLQRCFRPGWKVAITAGSRGIRRIPVILREIATVLKEYQVEPFVIGCMGSHGGDAVGQKSILTHLGITDENIGVPVTTSDTLVAAGLTSDGRIVYADSAAAAADALVVVNRIKPHTAFHAPVESGLQKMLAIGLGKQKGADACHAFGFNGMYENIREYSQVIMGRLNVALGVGIIENAFGDVFDCIIMPGSDIRRLEPELLEHARSLMPGLPFDRLDVLIVSEMGKDISGSGMDTNVIGRYPISGMSGGPIIGKIVVLDLTHGSEGNAHGVGFADFTSKKLFDKITFDLTYPNCLTNKVTGPAKIPPIMPSDKYAIAAAIKTCGNVDPATVRALWIKNTHTLERLYLSSALLQEVKNRTDLSIVEYPSEISFTAEGFVVDDLWNVP